MTIEEQTELELAEARAAKVQADLDYVAMMCDVEIHEEDDGDE